MRRSLLWVSLLALTATACTEVGERTQLSVGYYSIAGRTFDELDQQVELHGPTVSPTGRALAATNIRMLPDLQFTFANGQCSVASARVDVQAHVTLPRLANPERVKRALSKAWDNLEQYATLHESVHVAIADSYALKAEKAIDALPPEKDCQTLRGNAVLAFRKLMAEHEREQIQFDEDEKERIAEIVARSRHEVASAQ
ncbi:MAG: DUF922 domain-containing protein [Salaquimonas sp.]|jgi:predicted secreted Zn-dependent protease|nr:DUF922 domain-containing protein [Salaquimonas sp.]